MSVYKTQLQQIQLAYNEFITNTYTPSINTLNEAQKTLDSKKSEYDTGKKQLEEANSKLQSSKKQLDNGNFH